MENILLTIVLSPLVGAIISGLFRNHIGPKGSHWCTIIGVAISCILSLYILWEHTFNGASVYNQTVYTWMVIDGISFEIGFLIDRLSAMMMSVVCVYGKMVTVFVLV